MLVAGDGGAVASLAGASRLRAGSPGLSSSASEPRATSFGVPGGAGEGVGDSSMTSAGTATGADAWAAGTAWGGQRPRRVIDAGLPGTGDDNVSAGLPGTDELNLGAGLPGREDVRLDAGLGSWMLG